MNWHIKVGAFRGLGARQWLRRGIALIVVLLLTACSAMDDFSKHQQFVEDELANSERIHKSFFGEPGNQLLTVEAGTAVRAVVIWLHGTPGSWSDIGRLMLDETYTDQVLWVGVDRKGWGGSSVELEKGQQAWRQHRDNFASFEQQVSYLAPLVESLAQQYPEIPLIVAGHSWGASLAPALALGAHEVDGLVLLAGGYSAELMAVRWYHRLARTWLGRWVLGQDMQRATEEMFALPAALQQMNDAIADSQHFGQMPIYVIQGGEDALVPGANANYWRQEFVGDKALQGLEVFYDDDYGHLWHIQRSEVLGECVAAMLHQDPGRCNLAVNP